MAAFPPGGGGTTLVALVKAVIADYVKDGIPADLVEAAKRQEVTNAEFQKNSVQGLAETWSQALAVEGRTSPDDDIAAIRRVTVADVTRVARQYLINDTAVVAVLTPRPSGQPVVMKEIRRTETLTSKLTKPARVPPWAKKAVALPSLPTSNLSPVVSLLPNGMRVIVQPERASRTVSIYGRVKNNPDLQTPKGKEGVAEVLDGLFAYGTRTLDRLAFQKAVDDIGAQVSVGTDFALQVLPDHFERGAELLAENLLHPALPQSAFQVVRQQTADAVAGRLQSPDYLAQRALRSSLYPPHDPALREATPDTVASLTPQDVEAHYQNVFRPDMTTIVVIGWITPEQAKATIERCFGGWEAAGPKPETEPPPAPPNRPATTVVPDASRVQDKVTLAQTLGLTRAHPDYYTLQVGRDILAGDFFAARLYRDLREQTGLVYTVGALLDVGKTRSVLAVVYACDPPNVFRARALVERDLREMRRAPVTAAELRQTKTLLLRQIPLAESSVERIARGLIDRSIRDLPLDEPLHAAKRYLTTTAREVLTAFARWIRPDAFVQVTVGPNPG